LWVFAMRRSALGTLLVLLFVVGAALPFAFPTASAFAEVTVGKAAPNFSLPGSDGAEHSLSDFKGKFVVLEWLNPECPYVRKHYESGNMQALQKKYTEKGVVWLSVNSSAIGKQGHLTQETAKEFIADKKASPTSILLDPEGRVGKLLGASATPHMFVINPSGNLIYAGAIDDNDSTRLSSIEGANNYVARALDEAMSGSAVTVASTQAYGCSVKYAT
jgi:peroxiredoxin